MKKFKTGIEFKFKLNDIVSIKPNSLARFSTDPYTTQYTEIFAPLEGVIHNWSYLHWRWEVEAISELGNIEHWFIRDEDIVGKIGEREWKKKR